MKECACLDKAGTAPLVPVCFECGDIALQIRPEATLQKVYAWYTNTAGARMQDRDFKTGFDKAKANYQQAAEGYVCDPASLVCEDVSYGYNIFEEKGLLTAQEFYDLEHVLPSEAGLEPTMVPWPNPRHSQEMFLVDLKGLPLDVILGMRRVHIYMDSAAKQQEIMLRPERQLLPRQAAATFKHHVSEHFQERPKGLVPGVEGSISAQKRQRSEMVDCGCCASSALDVKWQLRPSTSPPPPPR